MRVLDTNSPALLYKIFRSRAAWNGVWLEKLHVCVQTGCEAMTALNTSVLRLCVLRVCSARVVRACACVLGCGGLHCVSHASCLLAFFIE
jgi:hypothetical protein